MTNEELASGIQQGTDHYGQLWERVCRLVYLLANRYYRNYQHPCRRAGVEMDDLIQTGFLAMCDAVKAFDPSSGLAFITYLRYPLKNQWDTLAGLRGRSDPLDRASSLDEPIGDSDTQTVADMVEDEQAAEDFHTALESVYNHQLHEALNRAMSGLDQPLRDVVTQRYYDGCTFEEIARDKGIKTERARTMQHNAFCKLRHPNNAKYLRPFRDEIISARAYRGTGMEAFRNSGMSSVERVAEYLDRLSPPA